jgi:hypothetical protein
MKTNFRLIACVLALSSVASAAYAQEKRNAVSLFGNITSSSDVSFIRVNLGYERLILEKTAVLVNLSQFNTEVNGNKIGNTSVSVGATQYLGAPLQGGKLLVYGKGVVSALRTEISGGATSSGTGLGLFAGLEQPISEGTSLFEELGYQRDSSDGVKTNSVVFNVGLKLRF